MKTEIFDDPDGELTLKVISEATRFNRWMFENIVPYCSGNILEIGSGIGNISQYFLREGFQITLSDIRPQYCEELKTRFGNNNNALAILNIDLVDENFSAKYELLRNSFDTVFALNVIEHIGDDSLAVANCGRLLKTGGRLVILVPAYRFLFNRFDKNLGHFRRYTTGTLDALLKRNAMRIVHHRYFNSAGIPGWYLSGKIMKNRTIPAGQMKFYDSMVPLFKLLDRAFFHRIGLSVISVGEKT
jgi:SAM-dependent methyltransferase